MELSKEGFALMHSRARVKAGKSQEYMAAALGVARKTVINWEAGVSSPTFYQTLSWFAALDMNPFPPLLNYLYPQKPVADTNEAFEQLSKSIPESAKQAILYLFYGEHGSSPNGILQLMLAHLHSSLTSRITEAVLTEHLYEADLKQVTDTTCLPDVEVLHDAINKAKAAVILNESSYKL